MRLAKTTGLRLLFIGAHCDDIEIGCGGTILQMPAEYSIASIRWLVFTSTPPRKEEERASADFFLARYEEKQLDVYDFEDTLLAQRTPEVKGILQSVNKDFSPDVIFTHYRHDLHQDHRLLNELSWNVFRNNLILEYEIPKYDGDVGNPSLYFPLTPEVAGAKVTGVMRSFPSQATKLWFDEETFYSLMRLRGVECASKYAEAFYMRKASL